jgi:hypothetical protein
MEGKEHLDYILDLVSKITMQSSNKTEIQPKSDTKPASVKDTVFITPEEIEARRHKLTADKKD